MRSEVKIVFGPAQEIDPVVGGSEVLSFDAARRWLVGQFVKNGCEPMRGAGKGLIADKILGVAATVGPEDFKDAEFALDHARYARAASGAPSKALLRVDIPKLSLSC